MKRITSGFTLMELILTMAIIAILSVIGIGSYTQASIKSRDTQRKNDINQIVKAIELFNNDQGEYPSADESGNILCPGLTGDIEPCYGSIYSYSKGEKVTYMDKMPSDPVSGRKYVYSPSEDLRSFALFAALENTEDRDVVTDAVTKESSDWGNDCGSAMIKCNYKLTEVGLIRSK